MLAGLSVHLTYRTFDFNGGLFSHSFESELAERAILEIN